MHDSFTPEFRLAAACAMWPPSDRRTTAIHNAAKVPLDWSRFLQLARSHQLIGLIHQGLINTQSDVPPDIMAEISTGASLQVRANLAMAAEALRLHRLFDEAGVPVLFVKGTALAMLAFGNLGLRSGQDIDLLGPPSALPAATALLARVGYRRFDPPPEISDAQMQLVVPLRKDFGFVHETSGVQIELHWRLFLNPHAMDEASIMADSRVVPISGSGGLRTLGEEDLFAYLCMHGSQHWWYRLKWLADVNALLAEASESDVERLVCAAEIKGAGRAAAQALLLCRRLLGTPLPDRLMAALPGGAAMRWLETTALRAITADDGATGRHGQLFGTTRGSLSTFLLRRSWRYRLAVLRVHLTNQTDVLTMKLPEGLRFLYPILRPALWGWRHATKISKVGDRAKATRP
jgi:hypothetical protein